MVDTLPFAITAAWEALCCDQSEFSQLCASTNTSCSCTGGAARTLQIGLLWDRLSQLVDLELVFCSCLRATLVPARSADSLHL